MVQHTFVDLVPARAHRHGRLGRRLLKRRFCESGFYKNPFPQSTVGEHCQWGELITRPRGLLTSSISWALADHTFSV